LIGRKRPAPLIKYKAPGKLTHSISVVIGWLVGYPAYCGLLVSRQLRLVVNQPREFLLLDAEVVRERTEETALGSLAALPCADCLLFDTEPLAKFRLGEVVGEPLTSQPGSE
jgi:hypothetical protein